MRKMMTTSMIAAFVAALALATGCEDTQQLTAGKDYKLVLAVNPPTVVIDPTHAAPTTTIIATILNATDVPQKGVLVLFGSTGGDLAFGSQGVATDANGNAYDVLTVHRADASEISVTATAAALTQTVKVTKTVVLGCSENTPPTALISGKPTKVVAGPANSTKPVFLDGTLSTDSETAIQKYNWDCGNSTPPIVTPAGGNGSTVTCNYVVGSGSQTYTATLVVTDLGVPADASCKLASTPDSIAVQVDVSP